MIGLLCFCTNLERVHQIVSFFQDTDSISAGPRFRQIQGRVKGRMKLRRFANRIVADLVPRKSQIGAASTS